MTSDGLVVTAAENKEFTVAVHNNGGIPTAVENVQTNHVQATKFFRDGMLLIEKNGKLFNVTGAQDGNKLSVPDPQDPKPDFATVFVLALK